MKRPHPHSLPYCRVTAALAVLSVIAAIATTSLAQTTTSATAPASSSTSTSAVPKQDDTIQLNPFEVLADRNDSYNAVNSNSITRFNIELNKVPLSADIFDATFMNDVAATSVEAMIQTYSAGAGSSAPDPGAAASSQSGDHVSRTTTQLRGFSLPYIERDSLMPVGSFYNPGSTGSNYTSNFDIERVEVINGPQALLYNGGGSGGVVNVVSKQARFNKHPSGSIKFQIDQHGSKMTLLDYGMGNDKFALRLSLLDNDLKTRRINVGGSIEGYYLQFAAKLFGNTTVRLTAEQTTYNHILPTSYSLSAVNTASDSRNGLSLKYLLATNQIGANTVNAAGQPNISGAIGDGHINWANVDSYGGWLENDLSVNSFEDLVIDTKWNSWLSSELAVGYDDSYYSLGTPGISFAAPQTATGIAQGGVWTASGTPTDLWEPGRAKAIRLLLLAENEFFNGKAHSHSSVGADFLRQDAAQQQYRYFQLNPDGSTLINPATIATQNGRTVLPPIRWSIQNGIVTYPGFGERSSIVTVNGIRYARQLENMIDLTKVSPTNPLGLTNTASYIISKAFNRGVFAVNDTDWMNGRLNTLIGVRYYGFYSEEQSSGNPESKLTNSAFNFSAGLNFRLTDSLRVYVTTSDNDRPPNAIVHDPEGGLVEIGHGIGEEIGLKFDSPDNTFSGSFSVYQADSKHELYQLSGTIQNDINPSGINGRSGSSSTFQNLDRTTRGLQLVLTANPTKNWRLRLSAAWAHGTILTTRSYAQLYNDQFYQNSQGQVTYADGSVVYVPATASATKPTVDASTAGATSLTLAKMNDPASAYYANPANPSGAINSSSNVATVLKAVDPVHGAIRTGATGLPISAMQITPNFQIPGSITTANAGDQTLGYPQYSANLTSIFTIPSGRLKGVLIGGTISGAWKQGQYYYFKNINTVNINQDRVLFSTPTTGRVDLILGYNHRFNRVTYSTQLNVSNLFNHYKVLIYPDQITAWSVPTNLKAGFFGEPRAFVWTNTIAF